MHRQIIMSHNLVSEIQKMLTRSKIGKHIAFPRDQTSIITVCLSMAPLTQKPSPYLCPNPKTILWLAGGYMQGVKHTGSTGFTFRKGDDSGPAAGSGQRILVFDWGFTKPCLIWLLAGQEVPCGICEILGTMLRHSMSSPNVVGGGAGALSSVWGWTPAGMLNLDVPYFVSCSRK
jgi:hypothetical protein